MAKSKSSKPVLTEEHIFSEIYLVRGHKIMLDTDLSVLYGIEPKVLKQAVRRNIERFPEDFMFELTKEEAHSLRSQFVTLKKKPTAASISRNDRGPVIRTKKKIGFKTSFN